MELLLLAERLGVEVFTGWPPNGWWGMWIPETRMILVRADLGPIQHRYALAHELAHAMLGHRGHSPPQEVAADILAAQFLIHHTEWSWAAEAYDCPLTIAETLEVPPHIVEAYHSHLERGEHV